MCIISTIMESCPSTSSFYSTAAAKTQHNGMNNIIRLFLKKGLVNDLARVPHSLDLSRYFNIPLLVLFSSDPLATCGFTQVRVFALYNQCLCHSIFLSPNMANTVNAALKPLETLSRIVNQPSSLFGGKGGSSKNKTEHDTVGTARDSNSNTQDQGTLAERDTCTVAFEVHLCLKVKHLSQGSQVRRSQSREITGCREQTMTSWMERQRETLWSLLVSQKC